MKKQIRFLLLIIAVLLISTMIACSPTPEGSEIQSSTGSETTDVVSSNEIVKITENTTLGEFTNELWQKYIFESGDREAFFILLADANLIPSPEVNDETTAILLVDIGVQPGNYIIPPRNSESAEPYAATIKAVIF